MLRPVSNLSFTGFQWFPPPELCRELLEVWEPHCGTELNPCAFPVPVLSFQRMCSLPNPKNCLFHNQKNPSGSCHTLISKGTMVPSLGSWSRDISSPNPEHRPLLNTAGLWFQVLNTPGLWFDLLNTPRLWFQAPTSAAVLSPRPRKSPFKADSERSQIAEEGNTKDCCYLPEIYVIEAVSGSREVPSAAVWC